jgi:hypothetical protein
LAEGLLTEIHGDGTTARALRMVAAKEVSGDSTS